VNGGQADRSRILVMRGGEDQARQCQERQPEQDARHLVGELGDEEGKG